MFSFSKYIDIPRAFSSLMYFILSTMRFSVLANDNDGAGRKGLIQYTGGIGTVKNVMMFGSLTKGHIFIASGLVPKTSITFFILLFLSVLLFYVLHYTTLFPIFQAVF